MGAVQLSVEMEFFCVCGECGVPIYGPSAVHKSALAKKRGFHCINGHARRFVDETEAEQLRKQLERVTKEKEWAEQGAKTARHAKAIAEGKLKAHSERVKNGVCPCCTRTFTNLRRHMATQHPEWKGEEK